MIAYLDMTSGISGDMFLGCLVDAGWPLDALRETIEALHWGETFERSAWSVEQYDVMKGALRATRVVVNATEAGQPHRHLSDIRALLHGSRLPSTVIQDAIAVFTRLAQAEGAVHGESAEQVHFHEVGALDSIIDIVGVCAGLHALGLQQLYAGPFPLGGGFTWSQHGKIPLPAPATLQLLAHSHAPIQAAPGPGELVTPTGAALVTHFVANRWQQPDMRLHQVAIGAGQKEFEWPNIARLWLGELLKSSKPCVSTPHHEHKHHHEHEHDTHEHEHDTHEHEHKHDTHEHEHKHEHHTHEDEHEHDNKTKDKSPLPPRVMSLLETNIDDMNPELYAAIAQKLFAQGARDVWWTPIQMKKNRPAITFSVLALQEDETKLADLLLRESTTLGLRVHHIGRYEAQRRMEQVETPFGMIPIKLKLVNDEVLGAVPEFDACKEAANTHNVSTRQVYEAAAACAWGKFFQKSSNT